MGDNTENQLGINQRGRLDEQLQRVSNPVRIHLPSHSKHAKLVQVSCGAFHTAAVTGQFCVHFRLFLLNPESNGNGCIA